MRVRNQQTKTEHIQQLEDSKQSRTINITDNNVSTEQRFSVTVNRIKLDETRLKVYNHASSSVSSNYRDNCASS